MGHPSPLCPVHDTDEVLIGCPCNDWEGDNAHPQIPDLVAALEESLAAAKAKFRTPRQRWGTCCPNDPECEHSFIDDGDLTRWMDTPISDARAQEFEPGAGGDRG